MQIAAAELSLTGCGVASLSSRGIKTFIKTYYPFWNWQLYVPSALSATMET
jgi:hypothetical protein